MKQYKLSVSENQLRVIMISLEDYFRTRLGQYFDLANDLSFCGFDYTQPQGEERTLEFDVRIARRDTCQDMMNQAYRIAQPILHGGKYYAKTPEMLSAIDTWHVIKHELWKENPDAREWTVDARQPSPTSGEPLAKIEVGEENER